MELRRFDCTGGIGSEREPASLRPSSSVTEKERLREGEKKELGDSEGRLCVGDG